MDSKIFTSYNNPEQLYRNCLDYAMTNMATAMCKIDKLMEKEGYAKNHPELIGQVLMAANIDYLGTLLTNTLAEVLKETNKSIDNATSTLYEIKQELEQM
ncbi:MAG: hypothetical protein II981_01910 [Bacteroidales bacterium]|nr:hypothetical protein [Bacteroidales bacterium]